MNFLTKIGKKIPHSAKIREEIVRWLYRKPFRDFPINIKRPLEIADLSQVPKNFIIKPPDFVGIGVPKAGTSWWHSLLLQHPDIFSSRTGEPWQKEVQFFCHFAHKEFTDNEARIYDNAFASLPDGISGEWSPEYLFFPLCIERLYRSVPNVKMLVLLRNPIDRAISQINYYAAGRKDIWYLNDRPNQGYTFDLFNSLPLSIYFSCYFYHLKRLFKLIDEKNILILQYEECAMNPLQNLQKTFEFLGVKQSFIPANVNKKINKNIYKTQDINIGNLRKNLIPHFTDDVRNAKALLPSLNLNLWPEFKDI